MFNLYKRLANCTVHCLWSFLCYRLRIFLQYYPRSIVSVRGFNITSSINQLKKSTVLFAIPPLPPPGKPTSPHKPTFPSGMNNSTCTGNSTRISNSASPKQTYRSRTTQNLRRPDRGRLPLVQLTALLGVSLGSQTIEAKSGYVPAGQESRDPINFSWGRRTVSNISWPGEGGALISVCALSGTRSVTARFCCTRIPC